MATILIFDSTSSLRVLQRGVFTWKALLAIRTLKRSEAKLRALQKERRRLVRELRSLIDELGPQYIAATFLVGKHTIVLPVPTRQAGSRNLGAPRHQP